MGLRPDGQTDRRAETAVSRHPSVTLGLALREPTFRWLTLAFCLSTAVAFGAQLHLVPILLEPGFSPTTLIVAIGLWR